VSTREETYELGARLTYALIRDWCKHDARPTFRFPPREYALLADLRDIGDRLAVDDSARRLVKHLVETVVAGTGQAPTAMMLRVILDDLGIPILWVSLEQLGLGVAGITRTGPKA